MTVPIGVQVTCIFTDQKQLIVYEADIWLALVPIPNFQLQCIPRNNTTLSIDMQWRAWFCLMKYAVSMDTSWRENQAGIWPVCPELPLDVGKSRGLLAMWVRHDEWPDVGGPVAWIHYQYHIWRVSNNPTWTGWEFSWFIWDFTIFQYYCQIWDQHWNSISWMEYDCCLTKVKPIPS